MIGVTITSGKLSGYTIDVMVERLLLQVDESGVKLESEGVIVGSTSGTRAPRRLILDRSFWLVMRERNRHPYLVLRVRNASFMAPSF